MRVRAAPNLFWRWRRAALNASAGSDSLDDSPMNAIVLVDKPAGMPSAEVVRRVKALVKPARVGHLGTLDPFATGLLPLMIGEATKLAPFLEGGDKRYKGAIALGAETDTLDREGEITRTAPVRSLTEDQLAEVARRFTGSIEQVPPVFSAIKRGGVPLYRRARRGEEVEAPPARTVTISHLELKLAAGDTLEFTMTCGPGTYARSLARDIALALGTVGHLKELRRLASGPFSIDDAVSLDAVLEALRAGEGGNLRAIALGEAVGEMPAVSVDAAAVERLRNGDSRALDGAVPAAGGLFRVLDGDRRLVAIARATSRITALIERVFNL
jgi:tRNA pseudouridine55 synthase